MASTQTWSEYNGASQTETTSRAEANWKRIDDSTTAYTANPINSSNNENSNPKVQGLKFAGTWNSISAVTYKIDNNAPATGLSIVGSVLAAAYPASGAGSTTSTLATGDSAMSTTGLSANLVTSATPWGTGTASSTASGTMYVQPLRTQLQTTSSYAGGPGDITGRTITASWTES
jgi:hypothetical protein